MATIEASASGGLWSATTAWTGSVVPGEADDVILGASSGSVTVEAEARCRSLDATSYTKTLTMNAELKIGTTTSNAGLALKLGASMTLVGTGIFGFVSTSAEVQKITTAGIVQKGPWKFTTAGKWQLQDRVTSTTSLGFELNVAGTIDTNGQTVECSAFLVKEPAWTWKSGGSTIIVTFAGAGEVFRKEGTLEGEPTLRIVGATEATKTAIFSGTTIFKEVVVAAAFVNLAGSFTAAKLVLNTAGKGATQVESGRIITVTESLTTNAQPGALAAFRGETPGGIWKLKSTSKIELRYVMLRDCTAEGATPFFARGFTISGQANAINQGSNTNWLFPDEQLRFTPLDLAVADIGSRW